MVPTGNIADISDTLGFVPSYLALADENADYRCLLWEESKRLLEADWSDNAARTIAVTTESHVRESVEEVVRKNVDRRMTVDPGIYDVVPFFAFVVFRVGLAIAACRYCLDGQCTRTAHARALDHNSRIGTDRSIDLNQPLSVPLDEGLQMTVPVSPDFRTVEPADANEDVSGTYERLRTELRTPNINTIFRALAVDSEFLSTVVTIQLDVYNRVPSRWRLERWIRNQYAASLVNKSVWKSHRRTLRAMGYESTTIDEFAGHIRAFHENIGTLAMTVLIAARLLKQSPSNQGGTV